MGADNFTFHRRAFAAFHQLTTAEQEQVRHRLGTLARLPVARWPAGQVTELPGEPTLYLVPVNDSLRLIVRVADGQQPEVQDVVRHETLESFAKAASAVGD